MFKNWGRGGHTLEIVLTRRLVLTVDPENTKAILATQFKDFGKGEEFNRDWYLFLGNGGSFKCLYRAYRGNLY